MNFRAFVSRFGYVIGLVAVIAIFAVLTGAPERYLSPHNLRVILAQTVTVAISAIGMTMIVVSGGIDLSVGSTIALSGVVTAVGLRDGWPPILAVAMGLVTGAIVGVVNALSITRLKVIPFIATLGMLGAARGAAKWMGDEKTVDIPATWVNEIAVTVPIVPWLMFAPGVWIAAVLAVVTTVVLRRTVFGRHLFAVGSNESAARSCGISPERMKMWIYGIAGVFFGLSGVAQMSRLRQGDPTVAVGTELDVIAAVVIGGASLSGGEGSIGGAMVGALIMAFLRNGSQQMGWPTYVQETMIGVIIVLAVAVDRLRARARAQG